METVRREERVGGLVGRSHGRVEDRRLLTGRGRFIDDIEPVGNVAHAAVVRSTQAHARIVSVDAGEARRAPGVVGVITGEDVRRLSRPFPLAVDVPVEYYPAAVDKVRYVGEPVAVVVAEDRYLAEDAAELVEVEYEELPAVVDVEEAMEEGAPLLHERVGSNVGNHRSFEFGDPERAFSEADLVVEESFRFPRYSSTPIETYGVIADYDPAEDAMTIWANFHGPFIMHRVVSAALGIPENRVRFVVPQDIGGSFGIKSAVYPYMALMGIASRALGRPVKWIEDRIEHLLGSSSGTGRVSRVRAAFREDGRLLGLDYRFVDDVGGYIRSPEPATMYRCFGNFTGPYRVEDVRAETISVMTNKTPTGLNRGFGGPQLYFALERTMDLAARRLGLDPAEIRRRNLIASDEFPYRTPFGGVYDSGNYQAVLERALEMSGYERLREEQKKAREQGRRIGVGLATIVDPSGTNMGYVTLAKTREERASSNDLSGCTEAATVSVDPSGGVTVSITTTPQGQGHETVATQIVCDELGVAPERVRVVAEMNTSTMPWTITTGSYSSRFAPLSASAIALAARRLREKLARIAAHLLDAAPEELEFEEGAFVVRGDPERKVSLRRAAGAAHWNSSALPEDVDPGLHETAFFSLSVTSPPGEDDRVDSSATYGFLADVAVVEVDRETCEVKVLDYFTVHDAGRLLNPMLAEGQIYGGAAHGLGGALYEEFLYDEEGQLKNASFMDYLCPTAAEVPGLNIDHIETPSPYSLLGAKGLGEGSTMSVPVAVANAISDALQPEEVEITGLPVTPERVFELLYGRKEDA